MADCLHHFKTVKLAQYTQVGSVRQFVPMVRHPAPGPLDKYKDNERGALCLVPVAGGYSADLVVLSTGEVVTRWTQNDGKAFTPPI